jgi:hypothetical protein
LLVTVGTDVVVELCEDMGEDIGDDETDGSAGGGEEDVLERRPAITPLTIAARTTIMIKTDNAVQNHLLRSPHIGLRVGSDGVWNSLIVTGAVVGPAVTDEA